ncbi:MAG: ATP-dependent ligase clustered with Ku protein LigD [Gammaproteobacteria bacterium]|jgi:bifunctional non-homologous end joining protein LigD|nr:ATP-dependent ligase clustered with Ku protein LigD [Gammaproteobacteria bacterium]
MKSVTADKHRIKVSHPDKLLFPQDRITKSDLISYYKEISPYLIPFLKDRPLTIQRFPDGIEEEGFFQQHAFAYFPTWFPTIKLPKKEGDVMEHMLCQDVGSLLYLVNQGMITPHRWLSTIQQPNLASLLVVDIDPPPNQFHLARKGAKKINTLFKKKNLTSFIMTSGSQGLHIVIPIKPELSFDECRAYVKNTIQPLVKDEPEHFTLEIRKEHRGDRVYLDIMRNTYGHTAVAPYAVRAIPGAPIAAPLEWDEVDDDELYSQKYTVKNIPYRLKCLSELWENFNQSAQQSINPS